MADESLEQARRLVQDRFGQQLAAKASDAFCLEFGRSAIAGEESFQPQASIVEFLPLASTVPTTAQAAPERPAWGRLMAALEEVAPEENMPLQAKLLLRNAAITSMRDEFHRIVGEVEAQLDRTAAPPRAQEESIGSLPPVPTTQLCWLNRTVRTISDPLTLGEVAADPSIERIDLPKKLEEELTTTSSTVGAVPFRERTSRTGKGIIVAVLDSEAALPHPYFGDRVIHRQNYTTEPWGNPSKHGTCVTGIITANGEGLVGIAPGAVVYNYKVLATDKSLNGDDFSGALALQQALEDGSDIANCSWGLGRAGSGNSREAKACDTAWGLGLTVVKSAGNTGPLRGSVTSPADASGVLVVGATDRLGQTIPPYSGRGPTTGGLGRPHLVAPGGTDRDGIVSCVPSGGTGVCGPGTSFAAPHVAALLALILEGQPDLTPDQQRDLLLGLCQPVGEPDVNVQGNGLVSLLRMA